LSKHRVFVDGSTVHNVPSFPISVSAIDGTVWTFGQEVTVLTHHQTRGEAHELSHLRRVRVSPEMGAM